MEHSHQRLIDWLLRQLETKNVSMGEASRGAGINQGAVSSIINGERPGLRQCKGLAVYFDVPVEQVLRMAGHLPAEPEHDELIEQAGAILRQMPVGYREFAITFLRMLREWAAGEGAGVFEDELSKESAEPSKESIEDEIGLSTILKIFDLLPKEEQLDMLDVVFQQYDDESLSVVVAMLKAYIEETRGERREDRVA